LNNIKLGGGFFEGKLYGVSDVLEEMFRTIAMEGSKLMKLKITKMNLRDEGVVQQLVETITYNKNIISLDLSYG